MASKTLRYFFHVLLLLSFLLTLCGSDDFNRSPYHMHSPWSFRQISFASKRRRYPSSILRLTTPSIRRSFEATSGGDLRSDECFRGGDLPRIAHLVETSSCGGVFFLFERHSDRFSSGSRLEMPSRMISNTVCPHFCSVSRLQVGFQSLCNVCCRLCERTSSEGAGLRRIRR